MRPPLRDVTEAVQLRRDLVRQGYTDDQLRALVRRGTLRRIRRGAYVDTDLWDTLGEIDRHRVLARAVLRAAHPKAVLSHVSAAVEHGADVWGISLDEVHLTRTDGGGGRREAGVVHHLGKFDTGEVQLVNGVPVSPGDRAALEVVSICPTESALVVVNSLLHRGSATYAGLAAAATRTKHWPHSIGSHIVLRLADHRCESVAETRTEYMCWAHHLKKPAAQVEVRDEHGHVFARVDFLWLEEGVFLEFDGRIKYDKHRRPGESLEDFLRREKRREERICQLTGWVCIRIGWSDLESPEATCRRIRALLASRQRPMGA